MGNGAVFQLVPQRFGREIGVMTGLVGMTGGVGGFYLAVEPRLCQAAHRQLSGVGFLVFALLALGGAGPAIKRRCALRWRRDAAGARRACAI